MKNLRPFDLQEALAGTPVMMRNGEKAIIRHHETEHCTRTDEELLGYLVGACSWSWCIDGASSPAGVESGFDIVGMYPQTRDINGFEVPAPESKAPEEETNYYLANPVSRELYSERRWQNTNADIRWLERGLVFLDIGDAVANSKAMMGIDPNSWTET